MTITSMRALRPGDVCLLDGKLYSGYAVVVTTLPEHPHVAWPSFPSPYENHCPSHETKVKYPLVCFVPVRLPVPAEVRAYVNGKFLLYERDDAIKIRGTDMKVSVRPDYTLSPPPLLLK